MKRTNGLKIATIRGVEIKLHVSLLFILVYIFLVGSAQFPYVVRDAHIIPGNLIGGPFLWGAIFAVALFISVLLHELGHVFVAQSMGARVRGITLMMLGGVSEMEQMPEKRLQEFKVAIVGPLVSFGLAAGLYLVESYINEANLVLFAHWLGRVNFVLAVFNLLPAFPMDGGRVLRSLLSLHFNHLRATQIAVKIGRFFAWVLGILGFFQFNILLMLIAVFLYMAASSELTLVMGRDMLRGVKAKEIARRIAPLQESLTIESAAREMMRARSLVLPVQTRSGEPALLGIETIQGIPSEVRHELHVVDAMEKAGKALKAEDPLDAALPELMSNSLRALPYEEDGHIVGLVLLSDLSETLQLKALKGQWPNYDAKDEDQDQRRAG